MKVKKGDLVKVISGKGAAGGKEVQGKILKVFEKTGRLLIEGYNIVKRHTRPNKRNQQGGIVQKEAPVHVSNVMLVSLKSGKPTRVAFKFLESRKKVRYSKKLQEEID